MFHFFIVRNRQSFGVSFSFETSESMLGHNRKYLGGSGGRYIILILSTSGEEYFESVYDSSYIISILYSDIEFEDKRSL